jgi:outer membrane protein OmpA-like peptidoglycan-associated protein
MKDVQNENHDRQLSGHFHEVNENGQRTMSPPPLQLKAGPGFNNRNPVMAKMEEAFDSDFSDVNLHTESEEASQMGALAYAQGNDVHFAPGQYNPGSQAGQELLGHELAHVVQQRNGRVGTQAKQGGIPLNQDSGLESEADAMGKLAAAGKKTGMSSESNSSSGPVQMKKHPLKLGGGDEWYGKDDSYWDVNTQLRITPNGKSTMEFPMEDGDVFQASAKIAQEMEAVNGIAEIVSETTTLVDNVWTNPQKDSKSVSAFEYNADTTNKISLHPINGTEEKIPIQGPYSMRRSLNGSNSSRINHQLQFIEQPWDVTETKTNSESETSKSGGDFSTGASQENKVNLQVNLNEEDIMVLLSGKPVFTGKVAEAKQSGALIEAVGGAEKLDSKDRVNLNIDNKTAQRIAGDFNYAWTGSSSSTETVSKSRTYSDPGDAAQENHTVVIDQALESLGKVNFEQEDQAELSEESKAGIRAFLQNNPEMLNQVLTKGSGYYIGLAGYTSSTGGEKHNKELAGIRAMQVRSFMIMEHPALLPRHFKDIQSIGKDGANNGFADPVDRRVEIIIGRKK